MDDCLRFEMAHIFSQETQIGLRNLGQTESETDQWSWLEYTEQWLTELAECSDHRAEASRCATHHHMIDVLWQIRSKAVVLMRETLDLGLPHRAAYPQTMQEDNAGRIRRSCFA